MPRSRAATRSRILDGAYRLFRRRGFLRCGMDEIARAAGVTKRTLYAHFESKDTLMAAMLEAQHALALAAFQSFGARLGGSPEAILAGMFRDLAAWADRPRFAGSGFTRVVVELADLPGHPARTIARRHKARLERSLAELLAQSGLPRADELARAALILSEGAIALMLVHRDRAYAAAAGEAALHLLALHRAAAPQPAAPQ
ncbi:MAG TPA: helix-turn-helix domain-containing protein [Acetobacteraceae bacterium]|nr:helix-turn-helix domain-containing protein [Acetobacteraceae bacterium]